jgi:hypothetical protein
MKLSEHVPHFHKLLIYGDLLSVVGSSFFGKASATITAKAGPRRD